jgi:ABC-2 type transport system permease protein
MSSGVLTVYRWELRKLIALKRTYLGLLAAAAVPLAFTITLALRSGQPKDVPFGAYVHQSGLAIPLVLLTFASAFLLPLITALVAGDIVASEDQNGTLKTIMTRSLQRGQIFFGKVFAALTYTLASMLLLGGVAIIAGSMVSGFHSLTTLSGTTVSAVAGLGLVLASFGVYLIPLFAVALIGVMLSTVTRNSAAAVVGTLVSVLLIELIGILPGLEWLQPYLLTRQFDAWQGLLRQPIDWAPITHAAWVCALYGIPSVIAGYLVFLRRDVAGG